MWNMMEYKSTRDKAISNYRISVNQMLENISRKSDHFYRVLSLNQLRMTNDKCFFPN